MNSSHYANEIPTLKKERRCRMIFYCHFEVVKKKFPGLQKYQCHWQERQRRCTQ